ncbi:MAG: DUF4397 domain-containing protein [Rubrivivax sp.]|jgi:hypothetical protein
MPGHDLHRRRLLATAAAALGGVPLLGSLQACGGGTDTTKAQLRFVNATTGYPSLDLRVDDSTRFSAVAYGGSASYVEVDPDDTTSEVRRNGSTTTLLSTTPALTKNRHFTLLAYGAEGALKTVLLDENTSNPDSGKCKLRVLNAAPDAGTLDIYVTGTDEALSTAVATVSSAAVGTVGSYQTISSGTRRLRITGAGSKTDLRLDLPSFDFGSAQSATLVLTPASGGVLVNALWLVERDGLRANANTQARVRVAAAVADSATVAVTLAGSTLLGGSGSPVVGLYSLVTAASLTPTVVVNGSAVTAPAQTLAAGGDYTLLVYGAAATPQVAWLVDDNGLPSDSTQARLRLVHGLSDQAAALALSVDFLPVASDVALGAASAYAEVAVSSSSTFSVTASGVANAVYSATEVVLVAGSTYTLFITGSTASTRGVLRKDR